MYAYNVQLTNFRNYKNLNIDFEKNINILYGNNAQGKTNIIEALYISGMGRSFRGKYDKEIIKIGEKNSYIQTFYNKEDVNTKISMYIEDKKRAAINGVPINRLGELIGNLLIVCFSPEDLNIIKEGPAVRRKFIDMELCQLNKVYYYELKQYNKVLKQRNMLLKKIKYNSSLKDTLSVWNEKMVFHGNKIIKYRQDFIKKINIIANEIHKEITGNGEQLKIKYVQNVKEEEFLSKLEKNVNKDIEKGMSSIGIQKDDILFFINDYDVKSYGSQGQQRTVALSLKLAEVKLIEEEKNETPILLLDDVFSELDKKRQQFVLEKIVNIQTIMTMTFVPKSIDLSKVLIYKVSKGNIEVTNRPIDKCYNK